MGIFKRQPKEMPNYLEEDFSDLYSKYSGLDEALASELEIGSQDVKKTVFTGPDRVFEVYSLNRVLKAVIEPAHGLNLKDRVYWEIPQDEDEAQNFQYISEKGSQADVFKYQEFVDDYPYQAEFLKRVYESASRSTAIELDSYMKANQVTVLTEPIMSDRLANVINSWDYLNLPIESLTEVREGEILARAARVENLRLADAGDNPVNLTLEETEYLENTAEEKYVIFAAEASTSWEEFTVRSLGFDLSDLYGAAEALVSTGVIELDGVPPEIEEEMPEMVEEPDALDALEAETARNNSIFELPADEMYVEGAEDEDWQFENSTEEKVPQFVATAGMFDSLTERVEELLNRHNVEVEVADKVRGHLAENDLLEDEVRSVELELEPLTREYSEDYVRYGDLKFDKTLEDLENDDTDLAEAERETVDDVPEMRQRRREGNQAFFQVEMLEQQRYELNEQRRRELMGLMGSVPLSEDDPDSVAVHDQITSKIEGIDNVENVAFFQKKTADDPVVAKANALRDLRTGRHADGTQVTDPNALALAYYALVSELGFDPVTSYRQEVARRQELLDALGNGGVAEADPRMVEAFSRLDGEIKELDALLFGEDTTAAQVELTEVELSDSEG